MKVEVIGVIEVEAFMIMLLIVQFFTETGLTVLIMALVVLVFVSHKITRNKKIKKIFFGGKFYGKQF